MNLGHTNHYEIVNLLVLPATVFLRDNACSIVRKAQYVNTHAIPFTYHSL